MIDKKKILLLNPPGEKIYIRDYYCSKVSKSDYIYHPVDLLVASGWLKDDFELKALDCIVEKITPPQAEKMITTYRPDAIFFITGAVSRKEDFVFLKRIKDLLKNCIIIGSGDCLLNEFEKHQKLEEWLDAIVLDFTGIDLKKYLFVKLYGDNEKFSNIVDLKQPLRPADKYREKSAEMNFPVPAYEIFPWKSYRYPFVKTLPFATVLTNYGCPFACSFCVMPAVGFKQRPIENIKPELDYIRGLGIRDIYFADQTFGASPEKLKELCGLMIQEKYNFNWVAFTRADKITDENIKLMKQSGCHMLMFGIESTEQHILEKYRKNLTVERIQEAFALCKKYGIKTLATFIIGLPETTYEENKNILPFAIKLNPDYASFNVLVPRAGTEVLKKAVSAKWLNENDSPGDQSGYSGAMKTEQLSSEQIIELKNHISDAFYKRPSYILKRLFAIRTFHELSLLFSNGLALLLKKS